MVAEYSTQTASNPTISYLTSDNLGSPRITTDANGQVVSRRDFRPFGEEISRANYGTDSIRQRFTGYEKDIETGLDFAEARYYNNQHGRFTAVDPLLASGKSANPQTFNRYVYVGNNPVNITDPSGLIWGSDHNNVGSNPFADVWGDIGSYGLNRGIGDSFDHVNRGTWVTETVRTTSTTNSSSSAPVQQPSTTQAPQQSIVKTTTVLEAPRCHMCFGEQFQDVVVTAEFEEINGSELSKPGGIRVSQAAFLRFTVTDTYGNPINGFVTENVLGLDGTPIKINESGWQTSNGIFNDLVDNISITNPGRLSESDFKKAIQTIELTPGETNQRATFTFNPHTLLPFKIEQTRSFGNKDKNGQLNPQVDGTRFRFTMQQLIVMR